MATKKNTKGGAIPETLAKLAKGDLTVIGSLSNLLAKADRNTPIGEFWIILRLALLKFREDFIGEGQEIADRFDEIIKFIDRVDGWRCR